MTYDFQMSFDFCLFQTIFVSFGKTRDIRVRDRLEFRVTG